MIDRGELLRKLILNAIRFSLLAPLASRYYSGVGAILMLHRVNVAPLTTIGENRHLTVTPGFLDELLTEVKRLGFEFVSMDETVERLSSGRRGGRYVTITADDAYRDNLVEALPVLEAHDAPMTIYVAPGLTEGNVFLWWELLEEVVSRRPTVYLKTPEGRMVFECASKAEKFRANAEIHDYLTEKIAEEDQLDVVRELAWSSGLDPRELGKKALLDWDELRGMVAHPLITIGAHTVHHYNLRRLSEEKARREITDAAGILEMELGQRPRHMAYPYGYDAAVGAREVRLAREAGYASAVTTRHGLLQAEHAAHLHALPRISINGRYQCVKHVGTMLSGITTPIANRGRRVVTV